MMSTAVFLESIVEDCGIGSIKEARPVSGGDINQAYCVVANEKYFVKVNDAFRYPGMFEKEANGLNALHELTNCAVPEVIRFGEYNENQYLILKWMEEGRPNKNFWESFGRALAELHRRTQVNFGFHEDNYIGSLQQRNEERKKWGEFYGENRILPLVEQLRQSGSIDSGTVKSAEILCVRLNKIFPVENPALLHGDLWSGNFMAAENGYAAIYDPAVYYGHREMDLGMTKLFGGFDSRFYEAYQEAFPLERNWKARLELALLYPLLVHAILFGGGYVGRVVGIIKRFE